MNTQKLLHLKTILLTHNNIIDRLILKLFKITYEGKYKDKWLYYDEYCDKVFPIGIGFRYPNQLILSSEEYAIIDNIFTFIVLIKHLKKFNTIL